MRMLRKTVSGIREAVPDAAADAAAAASARILAYTSAAERRPTVWGPEVEAPATDPACETARPIRSGVQTGRASAPKAKPPAEAEAAARVSREILRFRTSERALHWSIAVPFIVCLATGIILKLFFNHLHPQLSVHAALQWVHRLAGACLLLLPAWTALRHRNDLALYRYNIKRAWSWTLDDLKWLALIGPASVSRKVKLPDQHKFNAGEKLNFMTLTLTFPLLVASGIFLLTPGIHFVTWIAHVGVAFLSAPLIFGHIYLAVANPDTRVGLSGMFTGHVDRDWAKHHYAKWYRENFGEDEEPEPDADGNVAMPQARAMVRCLSCGAENPLTSWATLLESVSLLQPLECPSCGASSAVVSAFAKAEEIGAILEGLDHAGVNGPRRHGSPVEYLSPSPPPADEAGAELSPCSDSAGHSAASTSRSARDPVRWSAPSAREDG